jgi:hypothetical protein
VKHKEQQRKQAKDIHPNVSLKLDNKIKTTRLMKDLRQVRSSIADVETDNLLKNYDDVVYEKIKANLVAEMKSKKDALEQTRIRTKELGNQKKWLEWIEKYGDDLALKSELPKEDKREYLEGLLDRIEVRLDKETNDHQLKVFFLLGLVGDGIEYEKPRRSGDGYKVVEGSKNVSVVISRQRTQKKQVKK